MAATHKYPSGKEGFSSPNNFIDFPLKDGDQESFDQMLKMNEEKEIFSFSRQNIKSNGAN